MVRPAEPKIRSKVVRLRLAMLESIDVGIRRGTLAAYFTSCTSSPYNMILLSIIDADG